MKGDEDGMSDISENIRRLRRKKGLSQLQLAEQLHVTRQAVSGWETEVSHS